MSEQKIQKVRASLKVTCTEKLVECKVLERPCLFNIDEDPCERINLADDPAYADILQDMKDKLAIRAAEVFPAINKPNGNFFN